MSLRSLTFWFDFISPYSWLAFEKLPQALQGISHAVEYRPVFLGPILRHHGQLGPAEIPAKRAWTYRDVLWQGRAHGIAIDMPAAHPFNPLPLLRLALACGEGGTVNRHVCETVMRHVWIGGADAVDAQRLAQLRTQLAPARDPDSAAVKDELRANTEAAVAHGVFGVPTIEVDGRLFWGFDALAMLRAYIDGDAWFGSAAWHGAGDRPGFAATGKP